MYVDKDRTFVEKNKNHLTNMSQNLNIVANN